jgi:DNA-binding YbaB/EbfC family protein
LNPQDIQKMLGQAQQMQQQMEQRLSSTVVEATSGGGAVTVKMNGKKQVLSLKIDPTAVSGLISSGAGTNSADVEMLEDLIVAALNEAGRRADESLQSGLSGLLGGLNLPGF